MWLTKQQLQLVGGVRVFRQLAAFCSLAPKNMLFFSSFVVLSDLCAMLGHKFPIQSSSLPGDIYFGFRDKVHLVRVQLGICYCGICCLWFILFDHSVHFGLKKVHYEGIFSTLYLEQNAF